MPSEGYERAIENCTLCISSYDHALVADTELEASEIIAQLFPSLRVVLWLDLWESLRRMDWRWRATYVHRGDGGLTFKSPWRDE